jgi:hypothetical protein
MELNCAWMIATALEFWPVNSLSFSAAPMNHRHEDEVRRRVAAVTGFFEERKFLRVHDLFHHGQNDFL